MLHHFSFPTAITFGPGARHAVGAYLRDAGVTRPLIVTDRGLAELPLVAALAGELRGAGHAVAVFSGVWGNPTATQVTAGKDAYHAHQADAVVGLGGGAALDVAKSVALMAVHEGNILDYAWDHPQRR